MSNAVLNKFMNIFGMGAEEAEDEDFEEINEPYEEEELEEPKGLFGRKSGKVVSMAQQVRMVIMQPTSFEQSEDICDLLKDKKCNYLFILFLIEVMIVMIYLITTFLKISIL